MTTLENHKDILRELLEDIDEKIRNDLVVQRQKILGFALSEGSCHMLAILLLKNKLVSSGFTLNHRYFASTKTARERFGFSFDRKEEIIDLMVKQEGFRDKLCYGKDKDRKVIEEAVSNLYRLKELINKELGEEL